MVRYNIKLLDAKPLSNEDTLQDLCGKIIATYVYDNPVPAQEVADLWAEESDLFAKVIQAWAKADEVAEKQGDTVEWNMYAPFEESLEIGGSETAGMVREGTLRQGGEVEQTALNLEISAVEVVSTEGYKALLKAPQILRGVVRTSRRWCEFVEDDLLTVVLTDLDGTYAVWGLLDYSDLTNDAPEVVAEHPHKDLVREGQDEYFVDQILITKDFRAASDHFYRLLTQGVVLTVSDCTLVRTDTALMTPARHPRLCLSQVEDHTKKEFDPYTYEPDGGWGDDGSDYNGTGGK